MCAHTLCNVCTSGTASLQEFALRLTVHDRCAYREDVLLNLGLHTQKVS